MMDPDEILALLSKSLPDARVEIEDLRGDENSYAMLVESEAFRGLSIVDQHRLVFNALEGRVGGQLRSLTLTTCLPKKRRSKT